MSITVDDNLFGKVEIEVQICLGHAEIEGTYRKVIHVRAANEFVVPLAPSVSDYHALALADAISQWDVAMAEQADSPFTEKGPLAVVKSTIWQMLPRIYSCEFRDLFVETYRGAAA